MCMKNINTDVTFFSCTDTSLDVRKPIPYISAEYLNEDTLNIKSLSFLLSINAIERKLEPIHAPDATIENTIFFDQNYVMCFRLTEPNSGKFIDLDTYEFTPGENQIELCRKIFSQKISCLYQDVKVAVPPQQNGCYCVLKILIRPHNSNSNWIVQSIHPIQLKFPAEYNSRMTVPSIELYVKDVDASYNGVQVGDGVFEKIPF